MKYALKIGAKAYTVDVGEMTVGQVRVVVNGKFFDVMVADLMDGEPKAIPSAAVTASAPAENRSAAPATRPAVDAADSGAVIAPIPGLISEIRVKVGDAVEVGQCVAVMEAMKMENHLTAHISGIVQAISVQKGSEVYTGQTIMSIG